MGRDIRALFEDAQDDDFNPLSPHGERPAGSLKTIRALGFQSTLPAWGETGHGRFRGSTTGQISIHSPRMGRDAPLDWMQGGGGHISIHSPRMGRDDGLPDSVDSRFLISIHSPRMGRDRRGNLLRRFPVISIHSPCMGRDGMHKTLRTTVRVFQSTLPAWGETGGRTPRSPGWYFNPLSLHGERHQEELNSVAAWKFQSTLPAWGET